MSYGNCTFTFRACGDREQATSDIDIVVAAMKAAGWFLHSEPEITPYGPDAVTSPGLQVGLDNVCIVAFGNFILEEGYTYELWVTENEWETHTVLTDNVTPNGTYEMTYVEGMKFRIVIPTTPDPVIGPSTTNVP